MRRLRCTFKDISFYLCVLQITCSLDGHLLHQDVIFAALDSPRVDVVELQEVV